MADMDLTALANRLQCLEYLEHVSQLEEIKSKIFNELSELNEKLLQDRLAKEEKEKEEAEAKAEAKKKAEAEVEAKAKEKADAEAKMAKTNADAHATHPTEGTAPHA